MIAQWRARHWNTLTKLSLENGTQIEAPGPFTQAVMFAPSPPPPPKVSETIMVDNGLQEAHQNPAGWPDNTQDKRQLIDKASASRRRAKAEEHFRRMQENSRTWMPPPVEERVLVASPVRSRQPSMIPRPVPHQKVVSAPRRQLAKNQCQCVLLLPPSLK